MDKKGKQTLGFRITRTCWISLLLSGLLILTNLSHAREFPIREVTATEIDHLLRQAILENDLVTFSNALSAGGDPTAWFENSSDGWVMCSATLPGKESFLQQLIENGHNVNFQQSDIASRAVTALYCALWNNNRDAMTMLIEAGADPAAIIRPYLNHSEKSSLVRRALAQRKFDQASWAFSKAIYSEIQINSLIFMLEKFPINESSPQNAHRLNLAKQIREAGYDVEPWTSK